MIYQILFSFICTKNLIQMGHSSDMRNQDVFQPLLDQDASCKECQQVSQYENQFETQSMEDKLFLALDQFSDVKCIKIYNDFL